MKRNHGWAMMDLVIGMSLIVVVTVTLTATVVRGRKATRALADQCAAVRLAEQSLTRLQAGETDASLPAGASVRRLDNPGPAPGWDWAQVTAHAGQQSVQLTGPVPAAPAGGAK